ncbi:hypothetical protein B0H10DRAFT_2078955, partial [Mycena sp. CBHHK59/15]
MFCSARFRFFCHPLRVFLSFASISVSPLSHLTALYYTLLYFFHSPFRLRAARLFRPLPLSFFFSLFGAVWGCGVRCAEVRMGQCGWCSSCPLFEGAEWRCADCGRGAASPYPLGPRGGCGCGCTRGDRAVSRGGLVRRCVARALGRGGPNAPCMRCPWSLPEPCFRLAAGRVDVCTPRLSRRPYSAHFPPASLHFPRPSLFLFFSFPPSLAAPLFLSILL